MSRRSQPVPATEDVVVLGCGLMGAALARAFAARGVAVTVWNRTPERARALASDRISAEQDIGVAVRSARLVVGCTDTVESLRSATDPIQDWRGATLANLVSTTPRQAEETAAWVEGHHGRHLDGAIMCYPAEVGTPEAHFAYSGPALLWAEHRATLSVLGPAAFSDVSPGMASALAAGLSSFYTPALSAYVDAVTYLRSQSCSTAEIDAATGMALDMLRRHTARTSAAIASGAHETDQATIATFASTVRNRLPDFRAAGHPMRILTATLENLEHAEAAGLGHLGFSAQAEVR